MTRLHLHGIVPYIPSGPLSEASREPLPQLERKKNEIFGHDHVMREVGKGKSSAASGVREKPRNEREKKGENQCNQNERNEKTNENRKTIIFALFWSK